MDTDDTASPLEVGALVDYHGSDIAHHGRYRIERVHEPVQFPGVSDGVLAEAYPDGNAYDLWPEGVPHKWGMRDRSMLNVRPASITVIEKP